jgi:hypothetical protein
MPVTRIREGGGGNPWEVVAGRGGEWWGQQHAGQLDMLIEGKEGKKIGARDQGRRKGRKEGGSVRGRGRRQVASSSLTRIVLRS